MHHAIIGSLFDLSLIETLDEKVYPAQEKKRCCRRAALREHRLDAGAENSLQEIIKARAMPSSPHLTTAGLNNFLARPKAQSICMRTAPCHDIPGALNRP